MIGRGDERSDGDETAGGGIETSVARRLLPGAIRRRYAAKFFLSLLLVVLVIAGLGAVSYVQIQGIIEDDAEDTLRSTATLQADSVADWVASMKARTHGVAASDVYATSSPDRVHAYLRESQSMAGADVAGIYYANRSTGRIAASTEPRLRDQRLRAISPGLRAAVDALPADEDGPAVGMSDAAYVRNGNLRVAFAAPARAGDGVVVVVGDVQRDFEQLHDARSVETTRVLDADGERVLAPRQSSAVDLTGTDAFVAARDGDTTTYDQGSRIVAFAPVPDSPWVVATAAPKAELYRASDAVGRDVVALVAVSIVALGLVGVVLGRQTVPPIVRLRRRAQEMEAGNLDVDLRTARQDEIGRLYDSFASMRDALREQIREANAAREVAERSRRELERQNERLDQFAGTVSHDLRNPLTVARGNLAIVADVVDELEPELDGEAADLPERVDAVDDAHDRIGTIIEDVLALAREGETIEETEVVDLETVARRAWATVDTGAATLRVGDGGAVHADFVRLQRALENLFRNSVEHGSTSPDAPVTVTIGLTETGFHVTDDGPGIPDEDAEEVFAYGHTDAEDGTGLGLSIVDTIASAHGWSVAVDTGYDDGARFVFDGVERVHE